MFRVLTCMFLFGFSPLTFATEVSDFYGTQKNAFVIYEISTALTGGNKVIDVERKNRLTQIEVNGSNGLILTVEVIPEPVEGQEEPPKAVEVKIPVFLEEPSFTRSLMSGFADQEQSTREIAVVLAQESRILKVLLDGDSICSTAPTSDCFDASQGMKLRQVIIKPDPEESSQRFEIYDFVDNFWDNN